MQFIVFFIGAFALAHAGVIVKEHHVMDAPMERTSILGPSGSIVQENKFGFVETRLHEIEPAVKIIEPTTFITKEVPEVKSVVTVEKEVPLVKVETITPLSKLVPEVKSVVTIEKEVPLAKVETMTPLTHSFVTPLELPIFKGIAPFLPEYKVSSEYPVVPSWYSYPWYKSYYPYYNYNSNYLI